jgi:uncharacterized protein (DUF2147 family)
VKKIKINNIISRALFKNFLLITFLLLAVSLQSQSIFGQWKSVDHETGEVRSIVEIYEDGGEVYGKIVEVLVKEKKGAKCKLCPGRKKNKPLKGLVIIEGLKKENEVYSGGTVIDPAKGKKYRCKIWVDEDKPDVLNVRGFVSFFYKTQYWPRYK